MRKAIAAKLALEGVEVGHSTVYRVLAKQLA